MKVFFNSGLIIDDFKVNGKVTEIMKRITINRIVGDISLKIVFNTITVIITIPGQFIKCRK